MPPRGGDPSFFGALAPVRRLLGVSNGLVSEEDDVVTGSGAHEPHGLLVTGLCERALTSPEHDGEDNQSQLADQVVLQQRAYKLDAAGDDNLPVYLLL